MLQIRSIASVNQFLADFAGFPSITIAPFSISIALWATSRTKSMWWLTSTIVVPKRSLIFFKEFVTSLRVTGSRSPKGSSSMRYSGEVARLRAMKARTCSPPLSGKAFCQGLPLTGQELQRQALRKYQHQLPELWGKARNR